METKRERLEKELVIARLQTLPPNIKISIG